MPFVHHDNANIWYSVAGEGDPVTLIGGDLMASNQFDFVYAPLMKEFKLVNWDFRGIGASDRPEGQVYTLDTKVEDLKAVLDDAGIERTHLWGAATGSFTAIRFAHRYPERVGAVIHYGQCRPTEGGHRLYGVLKHIMDEYPWPVACEHMTHLYAAAPEFADWTIGIYTRNGSADVFQQAYSAELNTDITDELRQTSCPMMVMIGAKGPLGARTSYGSGWEVTRECRPDTELKIIEGGTGTYFMADAAEESARAATEFFRKHPIT